MTQLPPQSASPRPNPRSITLIVAVWLVLHVGCLFTPGLLDDVDSIYIEIAREMLLRHDYVTPYIDGIRFFDKPPLMYWLAAAAMRLLGVHDWAARLVIAFATLALLLATYALALRLFRAAGVQTSERAALYSALALGPCIGPFLYTRFFIPDILICLWMTLAVHAFLLALDRIAARESALIPSLAFAAVTALNLLTKGFIGLLFPLGFVLLYLAVTRQLRLLVKLHLAASTLLFVAIAAPWHILAALRNPAIALPPGLGLPERGGWAWFYLYNEHIARFLQKRIPHDYGQVPVWLFWLLAAVWLFPWTAFLAAGIAQHVRDLKSRAASWTGRRQAALVLFLWAGVVLVFFTFSARQEYYSLPALPALALMVGFILARAEAPDHGVPNASADTILRWHLWFLVPLGSVCALVALFFAATAPSPRPGTDIASLLAQSGEYNLSLSHLSDLTSAAMGLFRAPLILFGLSMAAIGPGTYLLRRSRGRSVAHPYAANLAMAGAATGLLLAMHSGLVRFYPTLGSKPLAEAVLKDQAARGTAGSVSRTCTPDVRACANAADLILVDGELTSGSTLIFYTSQSVHLINGRINGPWYGSFWPDAPAIFEDEATLHQLWISQHHIYLLTYHPAERARELSGYGAVHILASSGGKSILTN